jgi:predicted glycosyltransferase
MRILFDIVHPADVHFFKHAVRRLSEEGHEVLLTSRVKDVVIQLLIELGLSHRIVSRQGKGPLGLLAELGRRDLAILQLARSFRPDVLVGNNSPSVAHIGAALGTPSVVFDDTELNTYVRTLYRRFVTEIHTPRCYRRDLGTKQLRYPGYHALAYLHPDHFQPNLAWLAAQGLATDQLYFLFRFVRWGASHDIGLRGLTQAQKEDLVDLARKYGQVVISAEDELPESLEQYRCTMRVADMHQLVAGAAGLLGESATMCSEAACLGVPSMLVAPRGRGYTDELQANYGLTVRHSASNWKNVRRAAEALFARACPPLEIAKRHQRLLGDCINVSAYQLAQIARLGKG